ncbi:MAG: type II secretion system protein GspJ [Armatimonadota bacterium]
MSRRGRAGLTLVEVLVAVALTVLVATCVYGTVATAGRVRDRLEVAQQRRETAATALRLMAQDLRAAVYVADDENFLFLGEDYVEGRAAADSLEFATATNDPMTSDRPTSDLAQVRYFLDFEEDTPEQGLVRRHLAFPIPEDEELREQLTETVEIVPTARELDALYFDAETGEWLEDWEEAEGLPTAVKLTLVVGEAEEPPEGETEDVRVYSLLAHLASQFEAPGTGGAEEAAGPAGEEGPTPPEEPAGGPTAPGLPLPGPVPGPTEGR